MSIPGVTRRRVAQWGSALRIGLLAVGVSLPGGAGAASAVLDYLNGVRERAGLGPLAEQAQLAAAAGNHAAYLEPLSPAEPGSRGLAIHAENPGMRGFTGEDPGQRALAAGYLHSSVLENVSIGSGDGRDAVDSLMSAIYHRLAFLDLAVDETGAAQQGDVHVFLMGRGDLRRLCASPPKSALFKPAVVCGSWLVSSEFFSNLCPDLPSRAHYESPFPVACANGRRLSAEYMDAFCRRPPREALLEGGGRYYSLCDQNHRVRASWFDNLCKANLMTAAYNHDGRYYEVCDPPVRVHAQWLEERCAEAPSAARLDAPPAKVAFCQPEFGLSKAYLDELDYSRKANQPAYVQWPPPGGRGISPVFYEETPDPLPDLSVSGYPVSLQFNPTYTTEPRVNSFKLEKDTPEGWQRVAPVRLLSKRNDPQKILDEYEWVLFPLERLDWGSRYRVTVEGHWQNRPQRIEWEFRTRELPGPIFEVPLQATSVQIPYNQIFYLSLERETDGESKAEHIRVTYPNGLRVKLEPIDAETLEVEISGRGCRAVNLFLGGGRRLHLKPDPC
ncbi:MAG: CAP domain-containing protein [Pseudomonadota bacterium]